MKLYFISDTNEDGGNFDLFAIANNPAEDETLWQDYYGRDDESPSLIYHVAAANPVGHHDVKPHAINWHGASLPRVGGSLPADPR